MASTVAVTTSGDPIGSMFQRHAFANAGRRWVFYHDGSDIVWKSSTDGINWNAAQSIGLPGDAGTLSGKRFNVWLDKTQNLVHIAFASGDYSKAAYYRAGTPNADGSISWVAGWVIILPANPVQGYPYPFISTDTNGYAWVSYLAHWAAGGRHPYVTKSGNNNGTWGATPPGFPSDPGVGDSTSNWRCIIIPLTNGKMAHFRTFGGTIDCFIWDGGWSAREDVGDKEHFGSLVIPIVADGDDIHAVVLAVLWGLKTRHFIRPWATGVWTETAILHDFHAGGSLAVDPITHDLYFFYCPAQLVYKKYSGGAWSGELAFEAEAGAPQAFYSPYSVLGTLWPIGGTVRYAEILNAPASSGGNENSRKLVSAGLI